MAGGCCGGCETTAPTKDRAWRRVLWIALAINAAMFTVEIIAGVAAHSAALKADALDFLGDSANYVISLGVAGITLAMPAHSVKLWTSYKPLAQRWSIGAGFQWQSKTEAFLTFLGGTTGARQPAYAVVDLRAGYDLTDKITLAVNLNNVLDKRYYERVSGTEFGNFYGTPRNVLVTARLRY